MFFGRGWPKWLRTSVSAGVVLCLGCVGVFTAEQRIIAIEGSDSFEAKSAFARAFVTQERYERLRAAARRQFPELTEQQSKGLFLRWMEFRPMTSAPNTVVLKVGISYRGDVKAAAIADFAATTIAAELREARKQPPQTQ